MGYLRMDRLTGNQGDTTEPRIFLVCCFSITHSIGGCQAIGTACDDGGLSGQLLWLPSMFVGCAHTFCLLQGTAPRSVRLVDSPRVDVPRLEGKDVVSSTDDADEGVRHRPRTSGIGVGVRP